MTYKIKIYAKNTGAYLWGGKTPILPRVGDTIEFNKKYKVVKVVLHWLTMEADSIDVTIIVEKET